MHSRPRSREEFLNRSRDESETMYVTKRSGRLEEVSFDKVSERLRNICEVHSINCNYIQVAIKVIERIVNKISTVELDVLSAKIAHSMAVKDTEYDRLAARVEVSNIHKQTKGFYACSEYLYKKGRIMPEYWEAVKKHGKYLEKEVIKYQRDHLYDYFSLRSLQFIVLTKDEEENVIERPQDVLMRQALTFYGDNLEMVRKCYAMFSKRRCIHGTPTQMNAGITNHFSSCFLFNLDPTSTETFYETIQECASISANAGGSGGNCSMIPAEGTFIKGDPSKGVMSFLKLFDSVIRDSSTVRRKSSSAVYLDITHADIETFMGARLNERPEELKVKNIFLALMIPDLFMERVRDGGVWSLFCPQQTPGLMDTWGDEYRKRYLEYESQGKYVKQVNAAKLITEYACLLPPTGGPFCIFKDTANRLSNQQHLGTLMSMNLCTEVAQVSKTDETAVCNLASVSLPSCIVGGVFDHQRLYDIVELLTCNLNKVIDLGRLPTERCHKSNNKTRSIGIGISGLADTFLLLEMPFDSPEARHLNIEIAETMYYAFARTSCNLAKTDGPYPAFAGSLTSQGILNPDLHNYKPSPRWDYDTLRKDVVKYGMRNSLGIAPMPTSSSSQFLGNNESFEPFASHVANRKILSGDFVVVNRRAELLLKKYKCWEPAKDWWLSHGGSVKDCPGVPEKVRDILKTVWDIKPTCLIDMVADRNIFTDQSQSFTQHLDITGMSNEEKVNKIILMLMYSWERGLKTGMYYFRVPAATKSAPLLSDVGKVEKEKNEPDVIYSMPDAVCTSGGCTV